MFGGKRPKSEQRTPVDPIPNPSVDRKVTRRTFIEQGAKGAAGLVVGAELLRTTQVHAQSAENGEDKENVTEGLHDFLLELTGLGDEIEKEMGKISHDKSSIKTIDKARQLFLSRLPAEKIKRGLELADRVEGMSGFFMTDDIYSYLFKFDCLGLYYDYLRSQGKYKDGLRNYDKECHFYARVSDFCPYGKEVLDEEIDPRLGQLDDDFQSRQSVEKSIKYSSAWAQPEWQAEFRSVLDNQHVRDLLQNTNCTLAEAYSLVKAAVKYKKEHPDSRINYDIIMVKLLSEREKFMDRVIIGPEIDEFIFFNYKPKIEEEAQFDGDGLDILARLFMTRKMNGREEHPNQVSERIKRVDGENDFSGLDMRKHIWESKGKTTIYFNTHGHPNKLMVKEGHEFGVRPRDLASALITRLQDSANPKDLGDVNLVFASCYGYDFFKNFEKDLRRVYEENTSIDSSDGKRKTCAQMLGVPFEAIHLPTVVTAAQEGSISYTTVTDLPLQQKLLALLNEKKLTGEFYMRRIQPGVYGLADMAFFSGQQNGKLMEVGMGEVGALGKVTV